VPHNVQFTPQTDLALKWEVSQPATVKNWSAVPYWFGAKLQKELGVPVGIINNSFGGTTIQAWMSEATLKRGPWPQDKWTNLELAKADYDKRAEAVRPLKEKYEADKAAALAEKRPAPPMPAGLMSEFKGVTTLWNGEVVPLLPFRIRGVAWYQGESNAYVGVADTYHDLLTALIPEWRAAFEQPDLPFLIFQIARNRKWQTDPNENSGNAVLQEAQARVAASTTNTALIVTTDKGGPDVHYTDKEPIAARAVNAALSLAYAKPAPFAGPKLRLANVAPHSIVLEFDHSDGGLVAQDGPLTGFVIAGVDRKFVFADARIEGNTVVVSSPEVSRPVAVRYGWADLPKVNLFNGQGLPAAPFRTDDWPTTTKP
jgi:sialate O-acetylesterase